jgi:hypothetical protein
MRRILRTLCVSLIIGASVVGFHAASSLADTAPPPFTRVLSIGSTGDDVKALQELLNRLGFTLAESGPGSPGHETLRFGFLTETAVKAISRISPSTPPAPRPTLSNIMPSVEMRSFPLMNWRFIFMGISAPAPDARPGLSLHRSPRRGKRSCVLLYRNSPHYTIAEMAT